MSHGSYKSHLSYGGGLVSCRSAGVPPAVCGNACDSNSVSNAQHGISNRSREDPFAKSCVIAPRLGYWVFRVGTLKNYLDWSNLVPKPLQEPHL